MITQLPAKEKFLDSYFDGIFDFLCDTRYSNSQSVKIQKEKVLQNRNKRKNQNNQLSLQQRSQNLQTNKIVLGIKYLTELSIPKGLLSPIDYFTVTNCFPKMLSIIDKELNYNIENIDYYLYPINQVKEKQIGKLNFYEIQYQKSIPQQYPKNLIYEKLESMNCQNAKQFVKFLKEFHNYFDQTNPKNKENENHSQDSSSTIVDFDKQNLQLITQQFQNKITNLIEELNDKYHIYVQQYKNNFGERRYQLKKFSLSQKLVNLISKNPKNYIEKLKLKKKLKPFIGFQDYFNVQLYYLENILNLLKDNCTNPYKDGSYFFDPVTMDQVLLQDDFTIINVKVHSYLCHIKCGSAIKSYFIDCIEIPNYMKQKQIKDSIKFTNLYKDDDLVEYIQSICNGQIPNQLIDKKKNN